MQSFVTAIKKCENAKGAGSKAKIMDALKHLSANAQRMMNYTLNVEITFGVKKITMPTEYATEDPTSDDLLFIVLDDLSSRTITGNAARQHVTMLLGTCTKDTAEYVARIINKDLKAKFSVDTYNLVHPNAKIKTFNVMLAGKCETDDDEMRINFDSMWADVKYDGERNIAFSRGSQPVLNLSRSGLEATQCEGLFDRDIAEIERIVGEPIVVDGERFSHDWSATVNAKKASNTDARAKLMFHVFIIMTQREWDQRKPQRNFKEAREYTKQLIEQAKCTRLVPSVGRYVKDYKDMRSYLDEVTTPGFDGIVKGHEGLILKNDKAFYTWDRSIDWCKVKKFHTADGAIIGFYPGRAGTRLEKTLGGVIVHTILESGEPARTRCGSGFSDELRDEIYNNQEKYKGRTIEVEYQEISRSSKPGSIASLRFVTFNRFRDDKIVEI